MTSPLTTTAARLLLVPVLAIAAAALVKASSQVGDGFTAGLIAALAVVVQYLAAGQRRTERWLPFARRASRLAVAGLLLVLAVAVQSLPRGEPLLTHWPPPGEAPPKLGTLELTTQLALDLGILLLVLGAVLVAVRDLFLSGREQAPRGEER